MPDAENNWPGFRRFIAREYKQGQTVKARKVKKGGE
jgi:hypothetical protein